MTEIRTELKTIRVSKICTKCGISEIKYETTQQGLGFKSEYQHKCSNEECQELVLLDSIYPRIEYEEQRVQITLPKIQEVKLEVGKTYVTSKQLVVHMQSKTVTLNLDPLFCDNNDRLYLEDGTNVKYDNSSGAVFNQDDIIMELW